MGILVCIDEFTYDVVTELHLETAEQQGIGYDNSCEWKKILIEEVVEPGKPAVFRASI